METAGNAVFRLDPAGRIVFASLSAPHGLGHGRELQGTALHASGVSSDIRTRPHP
ncbi:hypothetical protein [Massilia psychrophila]|uniref:hypothetical protein n=1 Tax=Massilia psychrophila TaxID=1603353 RepID=UPI0015D49B2A|nr:hypothetical protein [Massilia psychrophila]